MTTKTSTRFHLGTPQTTGPLTLYPIFGGASRLRYRSLGQAVKHGAFISEVNEHGSVNDVLVCNASDQPVLLYEGELIYGARQNRTIDAPVLVPAGVELSVSVSCVEQGRWDAGQPAAHFVSAPHAADPGLRSAKRAAANQQNEVGAAPRPEQGEVWREVGERLVAHGVESASFALSDIYDAKRSALAELTTQSTRRTARSASWSRYRGARLRSIWWVARRCSLTCCRDSPTLCAAGAWRAAGGIGLGCGRSGFPEGRPQLTPEMAADSRTG